MEKRNKRVKDYRAECCRFGKLLPATIKHICCAPKDPVEFLEHKPHNPARYIKLLAYPDPPDGTFAHIRGWLRYHSPNFFSDSAIKDIFKVKRSFFMTWRKRYLRDYCKKNSLLVSTFPDPAQPNEPAFAPFGPKNNWLDKIDRRMRADDLSPGWIIKLYSWMVIIGIVAVVLLNWTLTPILVKVICLLFIIIFDYLTGVIAKSVDCLSEMRRCNYTPEIFIYEKGKLSHLLRNLRATERELKHYFPGVMTATKKTRPHPNKKSYSIKIVSHLMLNKLISPLFTHPEILTFNIEIVAEGIGTPPILSYWFDLPKSVVMAKRSLPLVNFIKDRMSEMIQDINEHWKFVLLKNTTDIDEKVTVASGMFIFTV